MTRYRSSILSGMIYLTIASLTGCVSLEKPYPEKNTFVFSVNREEGFARGLPDTVLLIRNFSNSARFQTRNFVYRTGGLEYRTDFYNEFIAPPGDLITEETARWLQQSQLFGYITNSGEPMPTHLLQGRVDALYGDFRPGHAATAVLELHLTLIDDRPATAAIVLDRTYSREIPLDNRSAKSLMQGWNTALEEILAEFEKDARQALLTSANSSSDRPPSPPDAARGPPEVEKSAPPAEPSRKSELFPDADLFEANLANPKEPRFYISWLSLDIDAGTFNIASVGFGENFGMIRWPGWGQEDEWQFGISGAVFAQFNLDSASMDLINADYIFGLPLSYRNGRWSARARLYHQSSHLGDEFLLNPQDFTPVKRINLSYETLELLAAWQWQGLRIGGGPSYIVHTDTPLGRTSVQADLEYHGPKLSRIPGNLFVSLFLNWWEETDWDLDLDLKAGINLESPYTGKRSLQFFGEFYTGHLPFGQFFQQTGEYFGIGISLGL
jgi:hypothetical protein